MKIVLMNENHINDLAGIEKICFHTPWTYAQLKEELENEYSLFLVAEVDGKAVGYVGCQTSIDGGYITNVAVHPDMRCKGIAQSLLNELKSRILQKNLEFITLEVRESNFPAISLYEKMNYVKVGKRKNFYTNPAENAIIMTYYID